MLTKADLRTIHSSLARLLPPGSLPRGAEEVVEIGRVLEAVAREIREAAPVMERGAKVFEWRVPRDQAPTMNQFGFMKGWQKKKLAKTFDDVLAQLLPSFPAALLHGARRRRWVRVTRFSTKRVDDLAIDILGGKFPVDALVRNNILADDNNELMHREPRWMKTKQGNSHVLLEVYEMALEGKGETDEPKDEMIAQVVRVEGMLTLAIKNAK